MDKPELRETLKRVRLEGSSELWDEGISNQLAVLANTDRPRIVVGYWPMSGEASVVSFFEDARAEGGALYLPRGHVTEGVCDYDWAEFESESRLVVGPYGVRQPSSEALTVTLAFLRQEAAWWLVPGLAFDNRGNRLGLGKGYYDRFLTGARGKKLGICYEWQLVDAVPSDPWDVRMDVVVTPTRCVRF